MFGRVSGRWIGYMYPIRTIYHQDLFLDEVLKSKGQKKYDLIWHFATYGQPAKFMKSWKEVIKLNIYDLEILTSLLKDNGHFFYASTSELYGNQKSDEFTIPSSDPLSQRSIYTESKRLGEAILNKELGDRSTFFRMSSPIFPYVHPQLIINLGRRIKPRKLTITFNLFLLLIVYL